MSAPPEIIFDLAPVHVLEGLAIVGGFVCLQCGAYFATVDAACAVACEGAA